LIYVVLQLIEKKIELIKPTSGGKYPRANPKISKLPSIKGTYRPKRSMKTILKLLKTMQNPEFKYGQSPGPLLWDDEGVVNGVGLHHLLPWVSPPAAL